MRYNTDWIETILRDHMEGMDAEGREDWLSDLEYRGCSSGLVMDLVTYHKALELYEEVEDDVLGALESLDLLEHEPRGETFAALAVWRLCAAFEALAREVCESMEWDEDEDEDD